MTTETANPSVPAAAAAGAVADIVAAPAAMPAPANPTPHPTATSPTPAPDVAVAASDATPAQDADGAPPAPAGEAADGAESPARRRRNRRGRGGSKQAASDGSAPGTTDDAAPGAQAPAPGPAAAGEANRARTPGDRRARKPHPTLQKLFELYPNLFGGRFWPLQRGVFQVLLEKHPDTFDKDALKVALGLHTRSTKYLERVAAGDPRHDLSGEPVEPVAPEHVHHAILEMHKRRQSRTPDDLRPQLYLQLIAAFEKSGLAREDYQALVRTQNAEANELVDAAFALLAEQVAKREALQRAYAASGSASIEAFAEMYGLDAREVERALALA